MNNYIVIYYNRFSNENHTFRVRAKNEYRAGRLFFLMHDRKSFGNDCIISIEDINEYHYWTEEEIKAKKLMKEQDIEKSLKEYKK